jgi:L-amino acid N-acyltransferase YncA
MAARIRFAEPRDAAGVQAVYAPYVESTGITFELQPPSTEEIAARMAKFSPQYPWLVCEHDGRILGYVYACPHRERAAYRWSVDVAVYIDSANHRQGIGKALYTSLLTLLREQGYAQAFAGITLPNPGSVGVHESLGFQQVAYFQNAGFKLGQWRDVGWWQLALRADDGAPAEPTPIRQLIGSAAAASALAAGENWLRIG